MLPGVDKYYLNIVSLPKTNVKIALNKFYNLGTAFMSVTDLAPLVYVL